MGCSQSKGKTEEKPAPSAKQQKTAQNKMIEELQLQLQGDALKEEEIIVPEKGFDEGIIDKGIETH